MTIRQPGQNKTRLLTLCCLTMVASPLALGSIATPSAFCAPAQPAQPAQPDHPRLTPSRDAVIDYVFQPKPPADLVQAGKIPAGPLPERHVQVLFSGDGGLLRIRYMKSMEGDDSRGSVIINRAAQEVLIILDDRKIYTRLVQQEVARSPFLLDMSMQFARKGQSQVIGQPCTIWSVQSNAGTGSACVTDDGFVLEQDGVDVDGLNGHLKATHISYDDVPASAFMPPAGYQEITPHSPHGSANPEMGPAKTDQGSGPSGSVIPGVGPTTQVPSAAASHPAQDDATQ
ncbi:DUF4412 domain-containing protein [Acetobacter indonesiensis]|uniref:DUF4412 domain-containing protein n=1 Tax=Acetobacter indonesiensis TaxID=104101 RepID=UPI0020A36976|nr:DUF4412 domain-containing protein [Acetobacter indonesiensis]MCP1230593.1 DUF4412 domain-containing protein [Acetobacter indonesiensis]